MFDIKRIIEPISSRCSRYRFKSLSNTTMTERLQYIAQQENLIIEKEVIKTILIICEGDLRKAITQLQAAARLCLPGSGINKSHIQHIASIIPTTVIDGLLYAAKTLSFEKVQTMCEEVIYGGYPVDNVLQQLQPTVLSDLIIPESVKATFLIQLCEREKKLMDGADEYLQLLALMSFLSTSLSP